MGAADNVRNILFDKDGSLTGLGEPTYVTRYYPHFDQVIADHAAAGNAAKCLR